MSVLIQHHGIPAHVQIHHCIKLECSNVIKGIFNIWNATRATLDIFIKVALVAFQILNVPYMTLEHSNLIQWFIWTCTGMPWGWINTDRNDAPFYYPGWNASIGFIYCSFYWYGCVPGESYYCFPVHYTNFLYMDGLEIVINDTLKTHIDILYEVLLHFKDPAMQVNSIKCKWVCGSVSCPVFAYMCNLIKPQP